jgi:hypothetical protein
MSRLQVRIPCLMLRGCLAFLLVLGAQFAAARSSSRTSRNGNA